MVNFLVWIDGQELSAEEVSAVDSRCAAENFVARREARAVDFPIASGRATALVHVQSTEHWWDVTVEGAPHPNYTSRVERGGPLESRRDAGGLDG